MGPRTKNEKALLALIALIVLGAGNFFGYQWLSRQQSQLTLAYAQLHADKAEAEADLAKQDMWAERKAWLEKNEPAIGDEGTARAQMQQYVSKGARDNKLEILEQSFDEAQHASPEMQISYTVTIKGPMNGLCHWLADLQKPESFYAVCQFSLKADQDQKSMICKLKLARFFTGGS